MARQQAKEEGSNEATVMIESQERLYWFGILPASESVEWPIPLKERDEKTGEFYRIAAFTAWELWHMETGFQKGDDAFPIFAGKMRQATSIGVRGFVFPAWSESVELHGQDFNRIPYAGQACFLGEVDAMRIVESAHKHFVRFSAGVDRANSFTCQTEIWDMELGKKPENMTEDQWSHYRINLTVPTCPRFNPKSDRLVSEFVYLLPLEADTREWNPDEYRKTPNKFHKTVVPQMDRKFFLNPPKSIAEMYPKS